MDATAALDPNIAALLGGGKGNDQFTQMLLRAINPNAAQDLAGGVGKPDVSPLVDLASQAPNIKTADPQPALGGPQMLQTLGFGMAAAAGQPGATAASSLGQGGSSVITQGAGASQRAIQEAQAENEARLAEWNGKSKIADEVLGAQMKAPELDMRMMDLTGQSLARDAARQDSAAYRAGLLENNAAKTGVSQQNADTAKGRLGVSQQRADTYDDKTQADTAAKQKALEIQQQKLDTSAGQFQQKLLEAAKARGQRLGLEVAGRAAQEFKNEMTLRKNPITGELPDESTQEALRQSLATKYLNAAQQGVAEQPAARPGKGAAAAGAYKAGQHVWVRGVEYIVGADGDSLEPA